MDVLREREREVFGFFLFLCDREDGRHSGSMRRWNQKGEGDGEKSDLPERGVLSCARWKGSAYRRSRLFWERR